MNQHTPGPWKTGREDLEWTDAAGEPFANIYHATMKDGEHHGHPLPLTIGKAVGENCKANARLIAAAPELLDACRAVQSIMWMAETYAEGGGERGPEMRDYRCVAEILEKAMNKIVGF